MGIATNDERDLQSTQTNDTRTVFSTHSRRPPSLDVVTAIADAIGDDPTTMQPLYEVVDTDALDQLLQTDASLEIVFEYEGHAIEVASDGFVTVDGVEYAAGDRS